MKKEIQFTFTKKFQQHTQMRKEKKLILQIKEQKETKKFQITSLKKLRKMKKEIQFTFIKKFQQHTQMRKEKRLTLQIEEQKLTKIFLVILSKKLRKMKKEIQSIYILRNLLQHQLRSRVNQLFGKMQMEMLSNHEKMVRKNILQLKDMSLIILNQILMGIQFISIVK